MNLGTVKTAFFFFSISNFKVNIFFLICALYRLWCDLITSLITLLELILVSVGQMEGGLIISEFIAINQKGMKNGIGIANP